MSRAFFDAHFHVIDARFPLVENQGFLPDVYDADDYRREAEPLGVVGGAVVSGSFQAFDQSYLVDALARLGPTFVGVTQLPASVSDSEIRRLDAAGVRAVRFNLFRGGSAGLAELETLARRVHDCVGWHAELYVDSRGLGELAPRLRTLPKVVIDHLGLYQEGLDDVVALAAHGATIKATGFGRVNLDVPQALRRIAAANPDALVFGTDLPSTRAPRRFHPSDIDVVEEILGDSLARKVLSTNGLALYRPTSRPST